jgi:hypothetical protein
VRASDRRCDFADHPWPNRTFPSRDGECRCDDDRASYRAAAVLGERAQAAQIEPLTLSSTLGDFNDDLRRLGFDHLRVQVARQLAPDDALRFMSMEAGKER